MTYGILDLIQKIEETCLIKLDDIEIKLVRKACDRLGLHSFHEDGFNVVSEMFLDLVSVGMLAMNRKFTEKVVNLINKDYNK